MKSHVRSVCLKSVYLAASITSLAALTSCGSSTSADNSKTSHPSYLTWDGNLPASGIMSSRAASFDICLTGSLTTDDFARAKFWARRSVLTWLRVAKSMDKLVTNQLRFTCDTPDLTFNLYAGYGTAYASPRSILMYMGVPYGTWTHELGHAFAALADTYYGGTAGYCQAGQPASVMCWGGYGPRADPEQFSTLWPDDIAGFQANYHAAFPGTLTPPGWSRTVDLETPLNVDRPWPQNVVTGVERGNEPMNEQLTEDFDVTILPGDGGTEVYTSLDATGRTGAAL